MPKKLTQEEYIQRCEELYDNGEFDHSSVVYTKAQEFIYPVCTSCGNKQKRKAYSHIQKKLKCGDCAGNKKLTVEDIKKSVFDIYDSNITLKSFTSHGNKSKFVATCKKHGDFNTQYVLLVGRESGCPKCRKEIKHSINDEIKFQNELELEKMKEQERSTQRVVTQRKNLEKFLIKARATYPDRDDIEVLNYVNMKTTATFVCPNHGEYQQKPNNYLKHQGCAKCRPLTKSQVPMTLNEFISRSKKMHGDLYEYDKAVYKGSTEAITLFCKKHKEYFDVNAGKHIGNGTRAGCQKCSNISQTSNGELSLVKWLKSLDIKVITSNYNIVPPKEIDIFLPDYNIAIEFNGLYWHSEIKGKYRYYHKEKYDGCKAQDIQLLTIFEDEWETRQTQVKNKIRHLLNKSKNDSVYGRKCIIDIVDSTSKKSFFDEHHIQGDGPSSINIGLYFDDKLVACMGFVANPNNSFTLNRYATSTSVVGGFSKLLKYFKQNYNWTEIVSFADCRWSDGGLYENNGWKLDKILEPDYSYLYRNKRMHKFNFRRKQLENMLGDDFNIEESEYENCTRNKIYRIWDCGKQRYIINK